MVFLRLIIALTLVPFFLSACGLVGESPSVAPPYIPEKYQPPCSLPDLPRALDKQVNIHKITQWLQCAKDQIQDVRTKIRGKVPGEISASEVRYLLEKGLIGFTPRNFYYWPVIEPLMGILHPNGRSAVHWDTWSVLVDLMLEDAALINQFANHYDSNKRLRTIFVGSLGKLKRYTALLSNDWRFSLPQLTHIENAYGGNAASEPVWILKALVFADTLGEGVRSDLHGKSIRRLTEMAVDTAVSSPGLMNWLVLNGGRPSEMGAEAVDEIRALCERLAHYFEGEFFTSVDTQLLQWAVRKISPHDSNFELIPDLVRVAQRFSKRSVVGSGLQPADFGIFLRAISKVGEDLWKASQLPWEKDREAVRRKTLLQNPDFRGIAFVTPEQINYAQSNDRRSALPPTEQFLWWRNLYWNVIERQVVRAVFSTFDRDGDGKIAYQEKTAEESVEVTDLAYSVLRLLSLIGVQDDPGILSKEERIPRWVPVKPSVLSGVLGLVGDKWSPIGNQNGAIESDELALGLMFQNGIYQASTNIPISAPDYYPEESGEDAGSPFARYSQTRFERSEFLKHLEKDFAYSLPWMQMNLELMGASALARFIDGITEKSASKPLRVAKTFKGVTLLNEPMSRSAGLPMAAVLYSVEKLVLACDANPIDEELDWAEMDCALPLAVEAALQVISSSLVSIDPGVYDAARLALALVGKPGPGLNVLKVAASLGSYRKGVKEIPDILSDWVENDLKLSESELGRFLADTEGQIGRKNRDWSTEASLVFRHCDRNRDGFFVGTELDCAADATIARWLSIVVPPTVAKLIVLRIASEEETRIMRFLIKTTAAKDAWASKTAWLAPPPLRTSAPKLLSLLGEILDRGNPSP
jgi:hypothetical protein